MHLRAVHQSFSRHSLTATVVLVTFLAATDTTSLHTKADEAAPYGIEERVPWTTSRVVGSPDPPLPYSVEKAFPEIDLKAPLFAVAEPGTKKLWVIERGGEADNPSRILAFDDDPDAHATEIVLEIAQRLVYSVTFHPNFEDNQFVYVFSNGPNGDPDRTNRVSRFTFDRDGTQACDPNSERVIIEWPSAGHDGGDLVFGHDEMLYITTGDGTSDSDTSVTGQDISDLLGGVLRIDVDHPDEGAAYSIPADNPFVGLENARGENWALGLRNPWRMCIDRETGQIWVGNNGQDLWETAHLLERGGNYGWSVYEGSHPFYLNRQRGPTPVLSPTVEHHHIEARSLTGGVVYYGEPLMELNGTYVYGDYSTGKIWGARHDGKQLTWHQELADTSLQIAGFAVSPREELLIVDHTGGLFELVPSEPQTQAQPFPQTLSETGLYVSVEDHQLHPGVIPYSVNSPGWMDGARAQRFVVLPGESQIENPPIDNAGPRSWPLPDGSVLVQTLETETSAEQDKAYRIETRLLTKQQGEWVGYSYRWNAAQTDATLVSAEGETVLLPSDTRLGEQAWRFPSRAECMSCHSRAANFVLGFGAVQLNRDHDYGGAIDNQLRTLSHIGLLKTPVSDPLPEMFQLVNPYDETQDLDARARSYLHTNCSVCHVAAGGGNAKMELQASTELAKMQVVSARPQHATFGIDNAMLVAPGHPESSVLMQRLQLRGRGQMPPLVSTVTDDQAVRLFHDWIAAMPPEREFVHDWKASEIESQLDAMPQDRSFESGQAAFTAVGCVQCHRFGDTGSGIGPDLTGISRRLKPRELIESLVDPSKKVAPEYATTVIATTDGIIVEGRIEQETDTNVTLREGGALAEPRTIQKSDIEERALSPKSSMPSGILNTLTQEEVLDLLVYLIADGQADHPAFATPSP